MVSKKGEDFAVIILAAGLGKRMRSEVPKVLARTSDQTLIAHVLETALSLNPSQIVVVTGHKRELVESEVRSFVEQTSTASEIVFALQKEQKGTGDAVRSAVPSLSKRVKNVLVLYGDVPLIDHSSLSRLFETHASSKAILSLISIKTAEKTDYGRIVRDPKTGAIRKIVEAKDCNDEEILISEVNSGIYLVDRDYLAETVSLLTPKNSQGEYYLTDIVEIAVSKSLPVQASVVTDLTLAYGVNDFENLSKVNEIIQSKRAAAFQINGVTIADPRSVYIEKGVKIAPGATIGPNVQLRGKTSIGEGATLEGSAIVIDSKIGKNCSLKFGLRIEKAIIHDGVAVGPFAHLRPDTVLHEGARIGNFVEVKKSEIHKGAKANHLTYIGDAEVGEDSNIGAGTITCNYDGVNKYKTTIGKRVFIGSNSALVAPVTLEDDSTVGAGSVITKTVPAGALGLTRAPLAIKEGWAAKKTKKK